MPHDCLGLRGAPEPAGVVVGSGALVWKWWCRTGVTALDFRSESARDGIMVHYKDLGLVNTKDLFKKAMDGGYAIPAYNYNNL